jgi:predicted transcriptional regulator
MDLAESKLQLIAAIVETEDERSFSKITHVMDKEEVTDLTVREPVAEFQKVSPKASKNRHISKKINVIKQVVQTDDRDLLRATWIHLYKLNLRPMTEDNLVASLKRAEEDIAAGRLLSHKEVMRRIEEKSKRHKDLDKNKWDSQLDIIKYVIDLQTTEEIEGVAELLDQEPGYGLHSFEVINLRLEKAEKAFDRGEFVTQEDLEKHFGI